MQRILSKREKLILYLTIAVFVLAAGYNFLYAPLAEKNNALNKEINAASAKLRKYNSLIAKKDRLLNRYDELSQGLSAQQDSKDPLVTALTEIETLAKQSGIQVIDIRPQTGARIDPYKEVSVDLRAQGSIEGYLRFLFEIENSLLLLRVKRLQLNVRPRVQGLEASFTISKLSIPE